MQIADLVQRRIEDGEFSLGEGVPSEAELEADHAIARTTARRAARELRDRGLVHTVQGRGTFVGPVGTPLIPRRTPLYQEIANGIIEEIRRGAIKVNRRIPSEKTLMQRYGVSKLTARHAVAFLRERGWVFTVPYRGTYVNQPEKWPEENRGS
ncbi:GntR family transcriptional regulator [Planomonospora sp. ID91781]|nr:GntR family transcriptional regulator [Planomonospora sp. ID91781]